jgi:hypothetical protein
MLKCLDLGPEHWFLLSDFLGMMLLCSTSPREMTQFSLKPQYNHAVSQGFQTVLVRRAMRAAASKLEVTRPAADPFFDQA